MLSGAWMLIYYLYEGKQLQHKADEVEVMARQFWHHSAKTLAATTVPLLGVTPLTYQWVLLRASQHQMVAS